MKNSENQQLKMHEMMPVGALHNGYINVIDIGKLEEDIDKVEWDSRDVKLMMYLDILESKNRGVMTPKRNYKVRSTTEERCSQGEVARIGQTEITITSTNYQEPKLARVEDYINKEVVINKYIVEDVLTNMYDNEVYKLILEDIDKFREELKEGTVELKDSYMKIFNVAGARSLVGTSDDMLVMINSSVNKYRTLDRARDLSNAYKEDIILQGVRVGELTKTEHKDSLIENYDKEDGGVWKIKRDMFKSAGYHKLTDVEDVETMKRDAESAASKEIISSVVAVPNLEDSNELTLTEEGVWTTSDKVHPKHTMLVVKNGVVLYRGFDGEYQGLDINSFFGNILVGLGVWLGKKRYFRGLFETGMPSSSSEFGVGYRKKEEGKTYHLKQQDGLRYLDELKGKELFNITQDFHNFNLHGGYLSGKSSVGKELYDIIPNLLDILNTTVELEEGLITRYYSLITLEDDVFRVVERATKLSKEDKYKEYVIKEKELTEDSLISWYIGLKEINERFKELKLIEEHNKKMELEQEVYDKAREYLPKYNELYDKHKDKLALNKLGKKLEQHGIDNKSKLEELTQDFNTLTEQVRLGNTDNSISNNYNNSDN